MFLKLEEVKLEEDNNKILTLKILINLVKNLQCNQVMLMNKKLMI